MTSEGIEITASSCTAQHSRKQLSHSVSLTSPTHLHPTTRQPLPQTSSPTRRNFNLHIDLPPHVPHHDLPPPQLENWPNITLSRDMRASEAVDVRRRGSTSSKGGRNTLGELGDAFSERMPMTPQEQVLRARLERVLSANAISPPPATQNPYSSRYIEKTGTRERRSRSVTRGYPLRGEPSPITMEASGGLWGWFWRDEEDSEDSDCGPVNAEEFHVGTPSPLSPLSPSSASRFLPTPQSAGATSSRTGFFDRHSSSSGSSISKQGRINSPPQANRPLSPGRPRSRTQPQPPTSPALRPVEEMDSPRMLSKAMESLSNHQRRSGSITRSSTSMTKTSSGSSSHNRTARSPSRPRDRTTLKVDVEPGRSGRRATPPSQSVCGPSAPRSPSDNELLITPPPTPPTDQTPSRIPVPTAVTRRAPLRSADIGNESLGSPVMERERNHRRARTAQVVEVDTTPTRKTSIPTTEHERERNHRRTMSVQVDRQPVRYDEFAGHGEGDGLPLSAPGTPRLHGQTYPQRSPRHSEGRALAPDPTQFLIVHNPAAPTNHPSAPSSPKGHSKFNVQTASAQCRAQDGYVSFAAVEGLGEPESEHDEAGQQQERKRRWLIF
ncbi:hypothetical protein PQX77_005288 [Marasmius sp. AFHP31]|nr:hypothetical protein PQX77_005288 [Marasmius sp. AFHP31]